MRKEITCHTAGPVPPFVSRLSTKILAPSSLKHPQGESGYHWASLTVSRRKSDFGCLPCLRATNISKLLWRCIRLFPAFMVTLGGLFILTLISRGFGLWYVLATCKDQGTVSEPALGFQSNDVSESGWFLPQLQYAKAWLCLFRNTYSDYFCAGCKTHKTLGLTCL